jgi:hypothetical protein
MVARIDYVQVSLPVRRQTMWPVELARFFTETANAGQILATRGVTLNAMVEGADPNPVLEIGANTDWSERVGLREERLLRAKTARLVPFVAPGLERLTVGRELLHPPSGAFGGEDVFVVEHMLPLAGGLLHLWHQYPGEGRWDHCLEILDSPRSCGPSRRCRESIGSLHRRLVADCRR